MSNRRRPDAADPRPPAADGGGFRLRHLLLLAIVGALVWQLSPRAKAAWELREKATQFADYALCMAGPTGPTLLRDQPDSFWELVRRRLITSDAKEAPFEGCADLAGGFSASPEIQAAHHARAEQFVEYGGLGTKAVTHGQGALEDGTALGLEQLEISTRILAELAVHAWPFERKGYTRLVRPSSHAKEAAHPAELPAAAVGSGLPTWRAIYRTTWMAADRWYLAQGHAANLSLYESVDHGFNWQSTSLAQPGVAEHAGRCMEQGSRNSFSFEGVEGGLLVQSWLGDNVRHVARLEGEFALLSASCDDETALLALKGQESRPVVMLCRHLGGCGALPVPEAWLATSFDIARVAGVSVVASVDYGLVRVRSSRDNGAHWTPATIAFDWQQEPARGSDVNVPDRLLKLGNRLVLHGSSGNGTSYPLLVSDDFGASWQGPTPTSAAGGVAQVVRQ